MRTRHRILRAPQSCTEVAGDRLDQRTNTHQHLGPAQGTALGGQSALAVLLFGALKTVADVLMHHVEHHLLQRSREPGTRMIRRRHDDQQPDEERPSKGARKRASQELQDLGEQLIDLPDPLFETLPLPEKLRDAILAARRFPSHGAQLRQRQYIGKLMRKIDTEQIRAALEAHRQKENAATRQFKRIEQWRERLLRDPAALERAARRTPASRRAARAETGRERWRGALDTVARRERRVSCFITCARFSTRQPDERARQRSLRACVLQFPHETAGRHHHGLLLRLGDDASGSGNSRAARRST